MEGFADYALPSVEYAKIVSEINSNYRLYEGKKYAAHFSVGIDGNYYVYYFVNRGFDDYTIVKRVRF